MQFCGWSETSPERVHGEAQAEEEEQGVDRRPAHSSRRRETAGDLHLGNDEGRERDVGRQRGAVGVDEGLDFLCLLIAGLNLQRKRAFQYKTSEPSTGPGNKFLHTSERMATEAAGFPLSLPS